MLHDLMTEPTGLRVDVPMPGTKPSRRYGGRFSERDKFEGTLGTLATDPNKSNFINWLPPSLQKQIMENQGYLTGTERLGETPLTIQRKLLPAARKGQGMSHLYLSGDNLSGDLINPISVVGLPTDDQQDISEKNTQDLLAQRIGEDKFSYDPKFSKFMQIGSGGNQDDDIRASLQALGLKPGDERINQLFTYDPRYGLMMDKDFYSNYVQKHSKMQDATRFDPIQTAAKIGLSFMNPYLGAAVQTVSTGGDWKDLAKNIGAAYVGGQVTSGLNPSLGTYGSAAAGNATKQLIATGKVDPTQLALTTAFSGVPKGLQDLGVGKGASQLISSGGRTLAGMALAPKKPSQKSPNPSFTKKPAGPSLQGLYNQYKQTKGK